jgi:hypothetical protein
MDLGVAMRGEILDDKMADGRAGRRLATWNTRGVPTRLTPGWTNRLFVACDGWWRGYFPLAGDLLWNPKDPAAALRAHLRPSPLDADRGRALAAKSWGVWYACPE